MPFRLVQRYSNLDRVESIGRQLEDWGAKAVSDAFRGRIPCDLRTIMDNLPRGLAHLDRALEREEDVVDVVAWTASRLRRLHPTSARTGRCLKRLPMAVVTAAVRIEL